MDHWQTIHGSPGKREAIPLSGSGEDISEQFLQLPSRRLVVLGRAGAGKTIVVSRFVLALLDRRAADGNGPVPVPLSAGSWDPAVPLRSWAAGQLAQDHPMLGPRDGQGVTIAERLLATRRIMLVIDGLDEISAEQQPAAVRQINAGLGRGDWLLVTSRPEEYATAVAKSDVITAAAVIELRDLTAEDVAAYLPLTTRKEQSGRAGPSGSPLSRSCTALAAQPPRPRCAPSSLRRSWSLLPASATAIRTSTPRSLSQTSRRPRPIPRQARNSSVPGWRTGC